MLIHQFVRTVSGVDPKSILTVAITIWVIINAWTRVWNFVSGLIQDHFTATLQITDRDELYRPFVLWLNKRPDYSRKLRSAMGKSAHPQIWEETSTTRLELVPDGAGYRFDIHGRTFHINSRRTSPADPTANPQVETIAISCLGRSIDPIAKLLISCHKKHLERKRGYMVIKMASVGDSSPHWVTDTRRSRTIDSVVLADAIKSRYRHDVDEFLRPHTGDWYADHGIPLRRGYLFSGPPGTGKTSLAVATAAENGLELCIISCEALDGPTLTILVSQAPRLCVLLLEDIDCAGIQRLDSNESLSQKKRGISLSELLNILDGPGTPEGRIVIITTNYFKKLDPALVRPGRVDLHVKFTNATREQVKTIFIAMYTVSGGVVAPNLGDITRAELDTLADKFKSYLNDEQFSPAQIQGFLLTHKNNPRLAVQYIEEWIATEDSKR
ncbi:P-loop containing nucleoside triphosphate hydrolase protein [Hypoxylon sp. FL0890]|nr:P-loop containing nucleoside triphosphate hydrolase protein [Hypoxylon sp. FL0890]